jgi:hypothetical protein
MNEEMFHLAPVRLAIIKKNKQQGMLVWMLRKRNARIQLVGM